LTFRFTAKQLRSIHPDHLGFILASSHCCNELTSVSPYLIFEHDLEAANEVEKAFIHLRFFTLVRLQIGKFVEYRDLCNKYVGAIRKTFPATARKIGVRSSAISRRIKAARWAETVRNKVAFHFDTNYALGALDKVDAEQKLKFIVGRMRGVAAFDFADRIIVNSMFLEAGAGDESKGEHIVLKWASGLQRQIADFHAETMQELFAQYGLMKTHEEMELRDDYCANPGSVCISLSTFDTGQQNKPIVSGVKR
jgi:hypothetical protein